VSILEKFTLKLQRSQLYNKIAAHSRDTTFCKNG